jgi:hypothetical protein
MPGGDRTGPAGYGPRTGRSLGYCSGYNSPGFTRGTPRGGGGFGRGWGRGFGRGYWGRGRGYWYNQYPDEPYYRPSYEPRPSADEEKQYLKDTIANLEQELDTMKKRLQDIEGNK